MKDLSLYETVPPLKNNFTIKFHVYERSDGLIPHWHEHTELLYFISGSCVFTSGTNRFNVGAGDFVTVNSGEIHSFTSVKKTKYYCILIYPEFFSDINFNGTIIENVIRGNEFLKERMKTIYSIHKENGIGCDMKIKGCAYDLMAYLMSNYTNKTLTEKEQIFNSRALEKVKTVTEYIAKNYREKISTSDLSKLCYFTESHFCRFFKKMTGKSAIDYINEFRIKKACALLAMTDSQMSEIAENTGYDDINYFSRIFKKIKGISPREFKKQIQENNKNNKEEEKL